MVMTQERQIPTALKVVSYLFLYLGVFAAIDMIVRLTRSDIHFDAGLLGFWIYGGLRRYSHGWRTCALVLIWIAFISLPIVIVWMLLSSGPAYLQVFGQLIADVSKIWVLVPGVLVFLVAFWEYRVLTRPDIYRLFCGDSGSRVQ